LSHIEAQTHPLDISNNQSQWYGVHAEDPQVCGEGVVPIDTGEAG